MSIKTKVENSTDEIKLCAAATAAATVATVAATAAAALPLALTQVEEEIRLLGKIKMHPNNFHTFALFSTSMEISIPTQSSDDESHTVLNNPSSFKSTWTMQLPGC